MTIVAEAWKRLEEQRQAPKAVIRYVKWFQKKPKGKRKRVSLKTVYEGTLKEMEEEIVQVAKVYGIHTVQKKGVTRVDLDHFQIGVKISYFVKKL